VSKNPNARSVWQIIKERVVRLNHALTESEANEMIFQPRPQDRAGPDDGEDFGRVDRPAQESPSSRSEFPANRRANPGDQYGASSSH
jgi:hypothetical protein